ncbi:hypothetical protein [Ferruginivarius sediminum]|uniref:hypothetical protein n=1 Tax=Ferruginivarius sediminum TaxID=2661937 RepID=UPI0013799232|nr:hypothetical protein [Ferruginivarius sediminum]
MEVLGIADPTKRAEIRDQLRQAAAEFNHLVATDASGPRPKQINERLSRIEELAGELARALEGLDQYSAEALAFPGGVPSEAPTPDLAHMLHNLSLAAHRAAGEYPDRGGHARPFRWRWSHPKAQFVAICGWVFYDWRPNDISGTADGDFGQLVRTVYEFATGSGADDKGVGLGEYIKRAGAIFAMLRDVDAELDYWRGRLAIRVNSDRLGLGHDTGISETREELQRKIGNLLDRRSEIERQIAPIFGRPEWVDIDP